MNTRKLNLGTFEVASGKLTVSDPCYKPGTWGMGELTKVRNGTWYAHTLAVDLGDLGKRISRLVIHHSAYSQSKKLCSQVASFEVGVDSGQAGFFDSTHYQDDSVLCRNPVNDLDSAWYSACCDLTLSPLQAGVIPYGVVSSSGFGDGGYDCRYWTTSAGHIVKAEIIFISEAEMKEWAGK